MRHLASWWARIPRAFVSSDMHISWSRPSEAEEELLQQVRDLAAKGKPLPAIVRDDVRQWHASHTWQDDCHRWIRLEGLFSPWAVEDWSTDRERGAHVHPTDSNVLRYTASFMDGLRGKVTEIKPGRYLQKFYPHLKPSEVQGWVDRWNLENAEPVLQLASTPDEIEAVYCMQGLTSCMDGTHSFESEIHPCRVYGLGDLAVAYLTRQGRLTARALVWPEKKAIGIRMYGDDARLTAALKNAGYDYRDGGLIGARLLKIKHESTYVMPYIDTLRVRDAGSHFVLSNRGDSADRTDGLLSDPEPEYWCERCEDGCDGDNWTMVGDDIWCDDCANVHAFTCNHCDQTRPDDEANRACGGGTICDRCARRDFTHCECCDDYYRDTEDECPDCGPEEPEDCAECGETLDEDGDCLPCLWKKYDAEVRGRAWDWCEILDYSNARTYVIAFPVGDDLCVTPSTYGAPGEFKILPGTWIVTHRWTGLQVRGGFDSLQSARNFAAVLVQFANWAWNDQQHADSDRCREAVRIANAESGRRQCRSGLPIVHER